MVPPTLRPTVDTVFKLLEILFLESTPRDETLSAFDTFFMLFSPLISDTYFDVAFLLSLNSTRNSDDASTEIKAENVLD